LGPSCTSRLAWWFLDLAEGCHAIVGRTIEVREYPTMVRPKVTDQICERPLEHDGTGVPMFAPATTSASDAALARSEPTYLSRSSIRPFLRQADEACTSSSHGHESCRDPRHFGIAHRNRLPAPTAPHQPNLARIDYRQLWRAFSLWAARGSGAD
jgi:hypothetical protein